MSEREAGNQIHIAGLGSAAEGCGCSLMVIGLLLLLFSEQVIQIIQAIRGTP